MKYKDIAVLIAAYKPDHALNGLIQGLKNFGFERIVVVDDGSGARYASVFNEAWLQGARVLYHEKNCGKGAAIKTGLAWLGYIDVPAMVLCDCDGQHDPGDVAIVAEALCHTADALVLGTRDRRGMPAKSKWGNGIMSVLLGLRTGVWVKDTQTGLRGLGGQWREALSILPGERYEYEMNMLLFAAAHNMPIVQVPIRTIYFNDNRRSHFKPVKDGLSVYARLLGGGQRL